MAEEKERAIQKDQEVIMPAGGKNPGDDLSEEDLNKIAGGQDKTHKNEIQL